MRVDARGMPGARPGTGGFRITWKRVVILVAAFAVSVGIGYAGYRQFVTPPAPAITGQTVPSRIGTIAATVNTTGSVVATRQARLTFPQGGRVVEVAAKLGDQVAAGQLLARVETSQLELRLAQAQSNLRTAELKLEQFKAGPKPEEIVQAQASLDSAVARLEDVAGGPVAADVQAAISGVESAQASVRTAELRLEQLKAGPSEADLRSAEQAIGTALGAVHKAEADLERVKAGATQEEMTAALFSLEQAKNSLWATQIDRDATCGGRPDSTQCKSADARVASGESSIQQAQLKIDALREKPDPRDVALAETARANAQDALASAQAKLAQLKAGASAADIQAAQSTLDSARAAVPAAIAKLDQLRAGAKASDLQQAQSSVTQARAALVLKQATPTPAELGLQEETVRLAEMSVKQAQMDLDGAKLVAPFSGIIGALQINENEVVSSGTQVATIIDPKSLRVDVTVDETDLARIKVGNPVQISFESRPGVQLQGTVIGIAPIAVVQQGVATYSVAIDLGGADVQLPAGTTATASIVVEQRDNVLMVPNRAIRRQGRDQYVEVLVEGNPRQRSVRIGMANDQFTEVVEGLQNGELVVIPATTTAQPRIGGLGGPGFGGPGVAGPASGGIIVR
jgi:HlyD family secretion protein